MLNEISKGMAGKHVLVVDTNNKSYRHKHWQHATSLNVFLAIERHVFKAAIVSVLNTKMGQTMRESLIALELMEAHEQWSIADAEFIIFNKLTMACFIEILVKDTISLNDAFDTAAVKKMLFAIFSKAAKYVIAQSVAELNEFLNIKGELQFTQTLIEGKTNTLEIVKG